MNALSRIDLPISIAPESEEKNKTKAKGVAIARTLLTTFKSMRGFEDVSTKLVNKTAYLSFNSTMSAERIVGKLIERLYKKQTITNLISKIKELVAGLKPIYSETLVQYFFKGESAPTIAENSNIKTRAVYGRLQGGLEEFARRLGEIGINTLTWNRLLREYRWIRDEYQKQLEQIRPDI